MTYSLLESERIFSQKNEQQKERQINRFHNYKRYDLTKKEYEIIIRVLGNKAHKYFLHPTKALKYIKMVTSTNLGINKTCKCCEGTGCYSWNGQHSICYRCGGSGVEFSKLNKSDINKIREQINKLIEQCK